MTPKPMLFVVDILAALVLVFAGLVQLATFTPKTTPQNENVKTPGIYAIIMTWDQKSEHDIDLYVRDPDGYIVYFKSREVSLMHLERDDLGYGNDTITTKDGNTVTVLENEERVILRGILTGEYIVNTHAYRKDDLQPLGVMIRLVRLEGTDESIVEKTVTLVKQGDEKTAFRFALNASGDVVDINTLSFSFVKSP